MQETTGVGDLGAGRRARFHLDGVGTTVSADVCHRTNERLTVRHALPFLRLESEVTDDQGRRARISSVQVLVEGDVPTLHMELLYPETKVRRDNTLPYGISTMPPAPTSPTDGVRWEDALMARSAEGPASSSPTPGSFRRSLARWLVALVAGFRLLRQQFPALSRSARVPAPPLR